MYTPPSYRTGDLTGPLFSLALTLLSTTTLNAIPCKLTGNVIISIIIYFNRRGKILNRFLIEIVLGPNLQNFVNEHV